MYIRRYGACYLNNIILIQMYELVMYTELQKKLHTYTLIQSIRLPIFK